MKFILAPDSFKHSMTAGQVCSQMKRALLEVIPSAEIISLPIGDGGEGTLDTMLEAAGGTRVDIQVTGSEFEPVSTHYGITADMTAIIEMASVCGLPMVKIPDPSHTTTLGVGECIIHALDRGCRKIILCIGGSATNDAGIGALTALGVRFADAAGDAVTPTGAGLCFIAEIDTKNLDGRLSECEIVIACDVDNPLYGGNGAAYVFAPQKGADSAMVKSLDVGLRHFSDVVYKTQNMDISAIKGGGAAGGIGAGLSAFMDVTLKPGIELVLDALRFDEAIADADYIFTGEGCTDMQTLCGKVPLGVAKRAAIQNKKVIIISGSVNGEVDKNLYDSSVTAVFSCTRIPQEFEQIKHLCPQWLYETTVNIARLLCR